MVVHIVAGVIPSEIGNLQYLELLVIRLNNFTGPIPFEIFNISTITDIDMAYNNLLGHLPSNVASSFQIFMAFILKETN
jgi:LRR receptor-like serine/threonine-protein kinase FLS2